MSDFQKKKITGMIKGQEKKIQSEETKTSARIKLREYRKVEGKKNPYTHHPKMTDILLTILFILLSVHRLITVSQTCTQIKC